jgi:hypothetical protein
MISTSLQEVSELELLTEFHLAVLSIVILAPCFEPVSPWFLKLGDRLTYLEVAPDPWM